MATYASDGSKLLNAEYDYIAQVNDVIDGMIVLSTHSKSDDEYAVFLLEANAKVTCYVFDEIFIVGKSDSFDTLVETIEAWKNDEI
mgnify:CR=1 FL=1|jgi:hypothetical protein